MTQKLTRTTRANLLRVLTCLERAQKYLDSDRIAICVVDDRATTSLHFTRNYVPGIDKSEADALPLYRVAKDIGSDPMFNARRHAHTLKHILQA